MEEAVNVADVEEGAAAWEKFQYSTSSSQAFSLFFLFL
jgi:hypothetical protein